MFSGLLLFFVVTVAWPSAISSWRHDFILEARSRFQHPKLLLLLLLLLWPLAITGGWAFTPSSSRLPVELFHPRRAVNVSASWASCWGWPSSSKPRQYLEKSLRSEGFPDDPPDPLGPSLPRERLQPLRQQMKVMQAVATITAAARQRMEALQENGASMHRR